MLLVELVGDDRHIRPRSPDRIEFGGSGPGEGQRGGEGGELAGGGVESLARNAGSWSNGVAEC